MTKWIMVRRCTHTDIDGACFIEKMNSDTPPDPKEVNVFIVFEDLKLLEKDEIQQTLTAHLGMKMLWSDHRMKTNFSHEDEKDTVYDEINIRALKYLMMGKEIRDVLRVWLPDYDFDRQLKVTPYYAEKSFLTSLKVLRKALGKNSSMIELGLDMKLTVQCEFDFSDYPMDTQNCNFVLRNRRFANNKFWLPMHHQMFSSSQPHLELGSTIRVSGMGGTGNIANKTGIKIEMKRVLTPFVLQCYSPTVATVLISAIGFIVPWSDITGKITLEVTLFLTLCSIFYDSRVSANYF